MDPKNGIGGKALNVREVPLHTEIIEVPPPPPPPSKQKTLGEATRDGIGAGFKT